MQNKSICISTPTALSLAALPTLGVSLHPVNSGSVDSSTTVTNAVSRACCCCSAMSEDKMKSSGRLPPASRAHALAPRANKRQEMTVCPFCTARCSGVNRLPRAIDEGGARMEDSALTFAPANSKQSTMPKWP